MTVTVVFIANPIIISVAAVTAAVAAVVANVTPSPPPSLASSLRVRF
jgi:hypothetical protein